MGKPNIDDLFAGKLRTLEQAPTPHAWESIAGQLAKKNRQPWWPWASVAASLSLLILSAWYLFNIPATGSQSFSYASTRIDQAEVPPEVVLIPVIIDVSRITANNTRTTTPITTKPVVINSNQPDPVISEQPAVANNTVLEPRFNPVIHEPLPVADEVNEEPVLATVAKQAGNKKPVPVTIIYKQGEPEPKSNFTKALTYLAEVRTGEKKLLDFNKIKTRFKRKIKLNKDTNSK